MTTTKDTLQIKSRYFNYNELLKSRGHIASEYIKDGMDYMWLNLKSQREKIYGAMDYQRQVLLCR
ncbi:MAG: hypothetical protein QF864_06985 [SAR202 cluster bacterium]|nr:hypothetical protein [SAR202 cluster bacterium]